MYDPVQMCHIHLIQPHFFFSSLTSRVMWYTTVLILIVLVASSLASYPKCGSGLSVGTICHIKAHDIKPTQFAYGRVASECKAEYLESMSSNKLEAYLIKCVHWILKLEKALSNFSKRFWWEIIHLVLIDLPSYSIEC
jgi:hypothetical protein